MGTAVRVLTLGLALATVVKVGLAVTDTDDPEARFFGYRLGKPYAIRGLRSVLDQPLNGQRMQVFKGRQTVDGLPVKATCIVFNGLLFSVDLETAETDADRMDWLLTYRLGQPQSVMNHQGHDFKNWTAGQMTVAFGYSPADRRYAATANLADLDRFRPGPSRSPDPADGRPSP